MKVVIVGSGISGLTTAFSLLRNNPDLDVKILEADNRIGGTISTRLESGCVIEEGPDSFLTTKPWALELCNLLNLQGQILQTNDANRRALIALNDELLPLPEGFMLLAPTKIYPFLDSKILSLNSKLNGAMEIFKAPAKDIGDETLKEFAVRRFGQEMFERIIQPMVAGIYTGDPDKLSAAATIPQFVEMEKNFGSVGKAFLNNAVSKSSDSGARYSAFITLKSGLQTLVEALTAAIGSERIELGCRVEKLTPADGKWKVNCSDGRHFDADAVVLAASARALSAIIRSTDDALAEALGRVEYSSCAVLNMLFDACHIGRALDGFGLVVPEIEKKKIIACSFASTKFAGRAPAGMALVRVFLGGELHPEIFALSDGDMIQAALHDLRTYLKISHFPRKIWIKRWTKAMPQYTVGHLALVERLKARFGQHQGLVWTGSALSGVGIPDCVRAGFDAAVSVQELTKNSQKSPALV
ncbi:MAG: protoporphyrinogen oxidase [Candidatus Melainabacteria bacterium]|nr:MAG: protoporphyrinogen oxidase [Candidatus Melainabacteria bacterium]